jgi:hypothetical protein
MRLLSKTINATPVHSLRFLVIGNPEVTEADKRVEEAALAKQGGDEASLTAIPQRPRGTRGSKFPVGSLCPFALSVRATRAAGGVGGSQSQVCTARTGGMRCRGLG